MAVYGENDGQTIDFYTSADLKTWKFASRTPDFFECPDLVELPVDDDKSKTKWVLYGADGKYLVGEFDGKKFTKESGKHQTWHGDFYAAQTFTNSPDGRCIQIGWGRNVVFPGMPFNQQMTVPVQLTLRSTKDGVRMFAEPVKETMALRSAEIASHKGTPLPDGKNILGGKTAELIELAGEIVVGDAKQIELVLRGAKIVYDTKAGTIACGPHVAKLPLTEGKLKLRVLVDRGSVELFADDGRVAISAAHRPRDGDNAISLAAKGGTAKVPWLDVYQLKSTWPRGEKK